jgi:glycerol-3-phosphate dehydrogenase
MEVVNAIHSIIPATNMDAVKRRTRTGMGRCQGGFCGNRVAAILAEALGIPITAVTKDGEGSPVFLGMAKDYLGSDTG